MGRGLGAVTLVALPPARSWHRDASSAVPERRQRADPKVEARKGRGHLALRCGRIRQLPIPARGRAQPQPGTNPLKGCRCISGRAPFSALRAGRPACALPAGGEGLARSARPSLRQWVWTWVGEEGEGRLCLLPLPPLLFSPANGRCHLFAVCHVFTVPCQAGWLGLGGQGGDCH